MYDLSKTDLSDFYFNGHWLSEYNAIVAGENSLSPFSFILSQDTKTIS